MRFFLTVRRCRWKRTSAQTEEAVAIVRAMNPEIVVEGEIGYIGSSSEIIAERPAARSHFPRRKKRCDSCRRPALMSCARRREHARAFGENGDGEEHKRLDIERIAEIKRRLACGANS